MPLFRVENELFFRHLDEEDLDPSEIRPLKKGKNSKLSFKLFKNFSKLGGGVQ